MAQRLPDIVSSVADQILPQEMSAAEAQRVGRSVYNKLTADNIIVLLIDHQSVDIVLFNGRVATLTEGRPEAAGGAA